MRGKILSASIVAGFLSTVVFAQQNDTIVVPTTSLGVSQPLYQLALEQTATNAALTSEGPYYASEMLQKHGPVVNDVESAPASVTALPSYVQQQNSAVRPFGAVANNTFEGPGIGLSGFTLTGAPPDTTMAVGPNHIVAWVNSQYAIFAKNGTVLLGPVNGNTLFTGVGGVCETTNRGDPILQYDKLADRWILSQFAFATNGSGQITGPYFQCVAVSTTNNPTGTYFLYTIGFSATTPSGFNDYGKLGIWPDGYYTTYNIFGGTPAGANTGVALCASDRTKMLAGDNTATTLCAPIGFYGGGASFLPGDLDGTTLPTTVTQGNVMMRYSFGGVSLRILKLKPNFAAGTVTITDGLGGAAGSVINLPTPGTVVACNGAGGACIPQPGTTTQLDTLADRLMYRLAYRNRGGVDSLVVAQSVDPDGAGGVNSAVRWYEIRSPFSATPNLFQNATYNPGASSDRWMASVAMDKMGNMLMGYSVANAVAGLKPSLRVAGRYRTDLRNQMQAESTIITGTGSQTIRSNGTALNRWGDYTTMQVDPVDDCTFWYIGQYLATDGVFNWRTRIASYKFNGCN